MTRRAIALLLALGLLLQAPASALAQGTVKAWTQSSTGTALTSSSGLPVAIVNNAGSVLGLQATPLRVDPTGTTTQPVSGAVTATIQQSNITADYDTGGGTQTMTMFGIALPGSGGAVSGGTASNPVRTDPTGTTTQPVSGTVTSNQGTAAAGSGAWPVTVTDTSNTVVKPGDAGNNAVRVNIVAGAGSGGTAQADRSAFTDGTTSMTPIGGVFNETNTNPTEDQAAAVRITNKRALHVNLRDASGTELSVGGGTQYDQGTVTTATDKLTMAGAVRHDTATVDAGVADGDRLVLSTDASGRLRTTSADVTQPVSGTVTTTPPSNASTNVTQFGGTNVSTGTGASGAGIPRVTISNDSSLAANQSVNVAQVNGVTTQTGTGAAGTGTQRVAVASDSTINAVQSGSWTVTTTPPSNATTNVTQFGGTNVSTGTGASGTGIPRVTVANDSNILATQSGTWTVQQGGAPWSMTGTKTNNNAAPGATNVGTLPAIANAAAPSYTEGNQVGLSVDLTGALRVAGGGGGLSVTDSATWTAAASSFTPTGGEYKPNGAPLASGQQGTVALTAARGMQANLVDSAGREVGASTPSTYSPPLNVSLVPVMPAPPKLGAFQVLANFMLQPLGIPVKAVLASGGQSSTGLMPTIYCNKSVSISTAASGNTQLVSLIGGQPIYVCGLDYVSTSALSVKFVYGTGSACATGQTDLEGAQAVAANSGKVIPVAMPKWFVPAGQALCINLSGATQVSGSVTYGQF